MILQQRIPIYIISTFVLQLVFVAINKTTTAYQPYVHTDPDFATSVHHLKLLVLAELDILASVVSNSVEESSFNNTVIKKYIEDFHFGNVIPINPSMSVEDFMVLINNGNIDVDKFADEVVKHPLKSYATIRRFLRYISQFPEITSNKEVLEKLESSREAVKFPKISDLESSMQNILRLRHIFKLSITDLMVGKLENMQTRSGLRIPQVVEIAEHAASLKMWTNAVDLYDLVLKQCRAESSEMCQTVNKTDISIKLEGVITEHDKLLLGNHYNRSDLSEVPPDSSPFLFNAPLKSMQSQEFANRKKLETDLEFEAYVELAKPTKVEKDILASPFMYEKLCRGDPMIKYSSNASHFRCTYLHSTHPYFMIGPLKAEIHSEEPLVIQFYNILSDNEIKELQLEVQQELRQSRTTNDNEGTDLVNGKLSRFRTSANAWIEDNSSDKFKYLNERVSRITGFNTTGYYSTEILQIAAYNPGGHYTPHSDAMFEDPVMEFLPESELEQGDRIMTFMLYLSDVEKGGGTGFPTIRTLISPVKGSAVAWYNLNSDGTINYDVLHGGCPVLYGTKWIANKWIRSNDQMFIRPCPKNREAWKI